MMIRLLLLVNCALGLDHSGSMVKVRVGTAYVGNCVGKAAINPCRGDNAGTSVDATLSGAGAVPSAAACLYNEPVCLDQLNQSNCEATTNNAATTGGAQAICLWQAGGMCRGHVADAQVSAVEHAACIAAVTATTCLAVGSNDCHWYSSCDLQALAITGGAALTAANIANPSTAAGAVEFDSKFVVGVKAFPLGTLDAADTQGGLFFDGSNDLWHTGLPFSAALADTDIEGATVTAPVYGFFNLVGSAPGAIKFDQWGTTAPATNAITGDENVADWQCQKRLAAPLDNLFLGTGVADASSGLQVITGKYVTIHKWLTSADCSAAAVTPLLGGTTFEKVSVQMGVALGNQSSCVQTAAAVSYSFECVKTAMGDPHEIWYRTYDDATCTGTAATPVKFTQAAPCTDVDGAGAGTVTWKIMNSAAEWDAICGWQHTGSMVALQTQSTCSSAATAAPATLTNRVTWKMFPMSAATDSNFTGQHLSSDYMFFNMGLPFAAKQAQTNFADGDGTEDNVLYAALMADASGDVAMSAYTAIPPWQSFIPAAVTKWYVGGGAAVPVTKNCIGDVFTDAAAGNGDTGGWQCTTPNSGGGISTGFAVGKSDLAITASLKWITIFQAASCTGTSAAPIAYYTLNHATNAAITYELVTATHGSAPHTGCQQTAAAAAYSFACNGADIEYNVYASKDCSTAATATTTFTKAASCQVVGSKGWWIQNSATDWEAICPAPTPAPTTASGASSASGSATSDAAVAATAAALAAGAAALIL